MVVLQLVKPEKLLMLVLILSQNSNWWWLLCNPARNYVNLQLELLGACKSRRVCELHRLVRVKRTTVVFLMETKGSKSLLESMKRKIGFANYFVVESIGKGGGLALM